MAFGTNALQSFGIRHSFVIFDGALIERVEDCLLFRCYIFSDEDQFAAIRIKRLEFPAASDEIEKLRAIYEANEAFCPNHSRRKVVREMFETIAGKCFIGTKSERFEFRMMPMSCSRGR